MHANPELSEHIIKGSGTVLHSYAFTVALIEFILQAKRAGVISERQMRIAAELDDHTLLARCYLYIALSEAQQARFAEARKIVRYVLSLKWYFLFVDIGLSSTST